jgi:hypothetical protein
MSEPRQKQRNPKRTLLQLCAQLKENPMNYYQSVFLPFTRHQWTSDRDPENRSKVVGSRILIFKKEYDGN